MRVVITGLPANKRQASSPGSSLLSENCLACRNRKTHPSAGIKNPSHSPTRSSAMSAAREPVAGRLLKE